MERKLQVDRVLFPLLGALGIFFLFLYMLSHKP